MNWLTNTVLPKIRALGQRKEVKDNTGKVVQVTRTTCFEDRK